MSVSIVDFLQFCIDQDEAFLARNAPARSDEPSSVADVLDAIGAEGIVEAASDEWWRLRGIADCRAKRQILNLHAWMHECPGAGPGGWEGVASQDDPCPTLRALAATYAEQPMFDPAWALPDE
jgi:hypothetical protein